MVASRERQTISDLKLLLEISRWEKTSILQQSQTHPLRISQPFYLDREDSARAYLYLRNNSPGILSGDRYNLEFNLASQTEVYFTEQSATKVHPMPQGEAEVHYRWEIDEKASLEYVPEPAILYRDAALRQSTTIQLDPTASLFWCDSILPGRLARGECYGFRHYHHVLKIVSSEGKLWFKEQIRLEGQENLYKMQKLFSSFPVMGTAIAIQPNIEIDILQKQLDSLIPPREEIMVAVSVLPYHRGIIIKALASKSKLIKAYWQSVISEIRLLNHSAPLPFVPK